MKRHGCFVLVSDGSLFLLVLAGTLVAVIVGLAQKDFFRLSAVIERAGKVHLGEFSLAMRAFCAEWKTNSRRQTKERARRVQGERRGSASEQWRRH